MTKTETHEALKQVDERFFAPFGIRLTHLLTHQESQDYSACRITLNGLLAEFRLGKTTPKKPGHFATLWQRSPQGITIPYDSQDGIDLFIISVSTGHQFGLFVFQKTVLMQQGYVSKNSVGGKRAMRIYPTWETNLNATAQKTQAWQAPHFIAQSSSSCEIANYWQTRWQLSGKA